MLKYVAAVVLIFGLSVYVSTQYKQHAENPASYSQQPANKALPAPTNKNSETNVSHPEWNPPRWYRLFGWPEGIGVWGLFLTLLAIAEQTSHTRRSADISAQIFVSTFRPRVIVRSVRLDCKQDASRTEGEGEWHIELLVVNIGETDARLDPWTMKFEWIDENGKFSLGRGEQMAVSGMVLEGGERQVVDYAIANQLVHFVNLCNTEQRFREGRKQIAFPVCSGTIIYADKSGHRRSTGFFRTWRSSGATFVASENPEVEYQD
jgi:hypothetical protein